MSSTHDHQVEEAGQASAEKNRKTGPGQSSTGESAEKDQGVPNPGKGPDPGLAYRVNRPWHFLGWSLSVFLQWRIQIGGVRF